MNAKHSSKILVIVIYVCVCVLTSKINDRERGKEEGKENKEQKP